MTINEIGKGTTSKVYLEKINGEERAVKIFDKDLPGIFRHREGFFLTLVQGSPFFPKVYEVTPNRIVMEKVAPNIYQAHRQSRSPIGKQDFQIMTRQLLEALDFTDSKAVVHADLKPENISYANGVTKVMDFGLSFFAKEDVFSVIQSSFYRAPEAVFKSSEIDAEADMWSLGCILFEMYTDKVLFESADDLVDVDQQSTQFLEKTVPVLGIPPHSLVKLDPKWKEKAFRNKDHIKTQIFRAAVSPQRRDSEEFATELSTLIEKMVCWRPEERIKPLDALAWVSSWKPPAASPPPTTEHSSDAVDDSPSHSPVTSFKSVDLNESRKT